MADLVSNEIRDHRLEAAATAIDVYAQHIESVAALKEAGRPTALLRSFNMLSSAAAQSVGAIGGQEVRMTQSLDKIHDTEDGRPNAGEFRPGSNRTFLAAHRRNLKRLKKAFDKAKVTFGEKQAVAAARAKSHKQSSARLSKIASKVLSGKEPTASEVKALAASVLSQDELRGA